MNTDVDELIMQAARELQITAAVATVADPMEPRIVTLTRKDGSTGTVQVQARATFPDIIALLRANSKSEVRAEEAKQAEIDRLEAELKRLKGD